MAMISKEDMREIIRDPNGTKKLIEEAQRIGTELTPKRLDLSTSQIRALFGEVKQIQALWIMSGEESSLAKQRKQLAKKRLILLKPKMAYRVGRETGKKKQAIQALVDTLDPAVDEVINTRDEEIDDAFVRFVDFFESILAYHRAGGGR